MPTRKKFQKSQFAYIKQSNSKDISESFGDTVVHIIECARSSVLDMVMASDFALASSHSLRGTDFLIGLDQALSFLRSNTASFVFS